MLYIRFEKGRFSYIFAAMEVYLMFVCSFLAGFVDAVAGGGGLIQLPALLLIYPGLSPAVTLSTNKLASFIGSAAAAVTYTRKVPVNWQLVRISVLTAIIFSAVGAALAKCVPVYYFRPLVSALLLIAAFRIATTKVPETAPHSVKNLSSAAIVAAIGAAGLYDGFFGPGTGTLIIYLLVLKAGLTFLNATATAKVVNLGTNFGAIIYFACSGDINFRLAAPLLLANALGAIVGAQIALKNGSAFIRKAVVVMITIVSIKVVSELFI